MLAWPDEMASRVVVWRSFLQKAMTVKFVFFRPKVLRNCGVTRRSRMFGHSSINILPNHSAGKLFTSPASSACLNFFWRRWHISLSFNPIDLCQWLFHQTATTALLLGSFSILKEWSLTAGFKSFRKRCLRSYNQVYHEIRRRKICFTNHIEFLFVKVNSSVLNSFSLKLTA